MTAWAACGRCGHSGTAINMTFEEVFTYEHLYEAYRKCKRNVGWKPSVQKYNQNAGLNVYYLYRELHDGNFKSAGFYEFDIKERGHERHIKSVIIKERICQRCLCDHCLVPLLQRSLIYDNGASLKGKGYTFAVERMKTHLKRYYREYGHEGYMVKLDIKKYFDNVPHALVEQILRKKLDDERLLNLTMQLVKDFGDVGLGLGSQVSQILAVAALNELDHFIKDECGCKYYGRYMDDFPVIVPTEQEAIELFEKIREKTADMGFVLNEKKSRIRPINGTEFLKIKWYLTEDGAVIMKPSHDKVVRMRRKLKKYKRLMGAGKMTLDGVYESWQCWEARMKTMHSFKERAEIINLIYELFGKEEWKNVRKAHR